MAADMRMRTVTWASLVIVISLSLSLVGQQGTPEQPKPVDNQQKGVATDEVVQRFAAKEMEFKQARDKYTYRQEMTIETLDGNSVDGEYRSVVDVMLDDRGRRKEHIVVRPQSTLRRIAV